MQKKELNESHRALRALRGVMLIGLASVPCYAAQAGSWKGFFLALSVGVLVAGSSAFVGGTLGFLFGIPRTLQRETTTPSGEQNGESGATTTVEQRIGYRANTNLEQISDWLTKILVGVGLTQIRELRGGLVSLAAFAAQGLGAQPFSQVFALALISYYAVLGFLFGYLWTRLFLAGALRIADQAAIGELTAEVKEASRKVDALKKQVDMDAEALGLAIRHLNPSKDLPEVTQEELDAAIAAASRPIKVQIFNQAWQVRSDNWRDEANKPKMERTIALFRALIHNDVENRFHMNHGQLGFALKDKSNPDWAEAETELTLAINTRGSWAEHGWLFYEFNRAICRIMNDPDFEKERASKPAKKEAIMSDLIVSLNALELKQFIKSDEIIQKWLTLNDVEVRGVTLRERPHKRDTEK
jgi:hypothetical protein